MNDNYRQCSGCMCPACSDCFPQPETLQEFNRDRAELAAAGEDIEAGSHVVLSHDGKVYSAGVHAKSYSSYIGDAVEQIREGFRITAKKGEIREDDA